MLSRVAQPPWKPLAPATKPETCPKRRSARRALPDLGVCRARSESLATIIDCRASPRCSCGCYQPRQRGSGAALHFSALLRCSQALLPDHPLPGDPTAVVVATAAPAMRGHACAGHAPDRPTCASAWSRGRESSGRRGPDVGEPGVAAPRRRRVEPARRVRRSLGSVAAPSPCHPPVTRSSRLVWAGQLRSAKPVRSACAHSGRSLCSASAAAACQS